jgi:hypothetical protein
MPRLANNPPATLSGFGDPASDMPPESVDTPSCDPRPETVRLASETTAASPCVSYAIEIEALDVPGRWFLSSASSSGNLMRTRDPLSAVRRDVPALLDLWANDLLTPEARKRLAARNSVVVPVTSVAGEPVGGLTLDLPEETSTE